MSITWVLVANTHSATLYENEGPNKGLRLLKQIDTEAVQSEPRRGLGAMDRRASHSPGEPQRIRARGFATRLAGELRRARTSRHYARAVLVAPPAFMGMINAELDAPTARTVSRRVEKDYTRHSADELCTHLSGCLCA